MGCIRDTSVMRLDFSLDYREKIRVLHQCCNIIYYVCGYTVLVLPRMVIFPPAYSNTGYDSEISAHTYTHIHTRIYTHDTRAYTHEYIHTIRALTRTLWVTYENNSYLFNNNVGPGPYSRVMICKKCPPLSKGQQQQQQAMSTVLA